MGIPLNLFIDTDIEEEYLCAICKDVLEDPQMLEPCQHAYCKSCIDQWRISSNKCPVDRQHITLHKTPPRLFTNLLKNLKVRCPYQANGCEAVLRLESFADHSQKCEYNPDKPKDCDGGCGAELKPSEQDGHNCVVYLKEELEAVKQKLVATKRELERERARNGSTGSGTQNVSVAVGQSQDYFLQLGVSPPLDRHMNWVWYESSDEDEAAAAEGPSWVAIGAHSHTGNRQIIAGTTSAANTNLGTGTQRNASNGPSARELRASTNMSSLMYLHLMHHLASVDRPAEPEEDWDATEPSAGPGSSRATSSAHTHTHAGDRQITADMISVTNTNLGTRVSLLLKGVLFRVFRGRRFPNSHEECVQFECSLRMLLSASENAEIRGRWNAYVTHTRGSPAPRYFQTDVEKVSFKVMDVEIFLWK